MTADELRAASEAVGAVLPAILAWVRDAQAGGRDPVAELSAMLATADAVADQAEDAKFGRR